MKKQYFLLYLFYAVILLACSKGSDSPAPQPTPTPTPTPPPTPTVQTCILTNVYHVNGGAASEFAVTINRDANGNAIGMIVFDSVLSVRKQDLPLNYVTSDSITIGQYQHIKLDANKRVVRFVTISDFDTPASADTYRYDYEYNTDGYLIAKKLYINNSRTVSYSTSYTYSNGLLTDCVMTTGGTKVFESALTYDNATVIKDWIYTFPDGFESFVLSGGLNFGLKCLRPLTRVVSKVYNPNSGALLDTWTTNYSSYTYNSSGYVTSGVANGDLQQGIAQFYGRTNFGYSCK